MRELRSFLAAVALAAVAAALAALAIAALGMLASPVAAAPLTGVVVDHAGKPVEFANVAIAALQAGATTDEQGRFTLGVPSGHYELRVSQMGYQARTVPVDVAETGATTRVTLVDEPVPVGEVVVSASSFGKTGKSEGATLRRMDIVTTPGGTADVFQSLRALPSIDAPNEGAAVYVRGGDPHETLVRLDGGEMGHPYHYEDASGGLFSAFDAYMLKSAFFSSGGFSAKYGGVLSGVLDIQSQDPWNLRTVSVGANLVGGGASTSWALVPDRVSFVGTGRFTRLDALQRLYGTARNYVSLPQSADGAGKLLVRYSSTGRVSLLGLGAGDQVQVLSPRENYAGVYTGRSRNGLMSLAWNDVVGGTVALAGNVTGQRYASTSHYGVLDATTTERNGSASLDGVWEISPRQRTSFGVQLRRYGTDRAGVFPADSTDLGTGAPTRTQAQRSRVLAPGVYAEHEWRVVGPLYATLGARADHAGNSGVWTWDPRSALAWRLGPQQTIRVAAGRYHELPQTVYLDPIYGNPRLRPLAADHLIAGYEWQTDHADVRVEAYHKRYRDLVTQSAATYYANDGHGYARGVDVLLQRSNRRVSGWIAYGYLDTRRQELNDVREEPAPYGVRHAVTLVGTVQATPRFQIGARYGLSSGAPYTPVVGGTFDPATERWSPVQAENFSGRLPGSRRLDVRLTRLFSLPPTAGLPASSVCVLYVEALNVLDRRNVLDYSYSSDYATRRPIDSYFSRRMAVAGCALTW